VTVNRLRPAILEHRVADSAEKLADMRAFSCSAEDLRRALAEAPVRAAADLPGAMPSRSGTRCRGDAASGLKRSAASAEEV